MGIDVKKLVNDAFKTGQKAIGKDVFKNGNYYKAIPGVGENPATTKKYSITAVFTDFKSEQTEFSSVQVGDLLVILAAKSIPFEPATMETIVVDAFGEFTVVQVKSDAAKSTWKLQVRRK
jgi:hypothetical protein